MFNPTGFLDIIIAFGAVMLALSLVVKVIQEFIKRMLDKKGEYYLKEAKRYLKPHVRDMLRLMRQEMRIGVSSLQATHLVSLARAMLDKDPTLVKSVLEGIEEKDPVVKRVWNRVKDTFRKEEKKKEEKEAQKQAKAKEEELVRNELKAWADENKIPVPQAEDEENLKKFLISRFEQLEKELVGAFDAMLAAFRDHYQRWMRYWAVGISFAVVCALNVDAIVLWQNLSKNQVARLAMASYTELLLKEAELPREVGGQIPTSIQEAKTSQEQTPKAQNSNVETPKVQTPKQKIENLVKPLKDAEIPFGWTGQLLKDSFSGRASFFRKLFGLLVAGFLVGAGAPFWHDLLESALSMKKIARRKENQRAGASP